MAGLKSGHYLFWAHTLLGYATRDVLGSVSHFVAIPRVTK
jgi:hypothetical protein